MRRVKFSIAGLMGLVGLAAVAIAAVRSGSEAWAGVVFTLMWATLGLAALGIAYRRGMTRAFWVGFAVFGGGYAALAFGPGSDGFRPRLATAGPIDGLYARLNPPDQSVAVVQNGQTWTASTTPGQVQGRLVLSSPTTSANRQQGQGWVFTSVMAVPTSEAFLRIGHGLAAILAGVVGGLIGTTFFITREPERRDTPAA